ncbi:N-acetylmuramoyl-L-alanine amidase [Lachnospiraceae bacterium KM106-2]|nr:N-acetylmuramoyl-L-alanine amidase [Lachnospiraceae bacterium KM106-2]
MIYLGTAVTMLIVGIIVMIRSNIRITNQAAVVDNKAQNLTGKGKSSKHKNIIVLDPGHGGQDQGTSCYQVREKDVNLVIAYKVRDLLIKQGYDVRLTRESDVKVSLPNRVSWIKTINPSCVISIHSNYVEQTNVHGVETYCNYADETSNTLATMIQSSVLEQTDAFDRKVQQRDYYLLRNLTTPSALVEVGFLSNLSECRLLSDEAYQNKIAQGIASGIIKFVPKINS